MANPTLLLVDDEEHLRSMLEAALRHHGFEVHAVEDGRAALRAVGSWRPDLVVLDVMLPDLDGFEVCRRLRADGVRAPVVFLTARDATEEKVRGLTIGGDDYISKPFSIEELVARIKAVLRRFGSVRAGSGEMRVGELVLDEDSHSVTVAGEDVGLSPTEFNLLRFLMFNEGRVVSKAQILDDVWSLDFNGGPGIVETYIGYLRRKVDYGEPKLIHTVRGVGYIMKQSSRPS